MKISRLWLVLTAGMLVIMELEPKAWAAPAAINVRQFGITGDGVTLNTLAVQRAIDQSSARGGATLVFPAGRYVIGTVLLKDNVRLRLESGATLLGSAHARDYHALDSFTDGTGAVRGECLLGASGAKHIGIEGSGTIDGRGSSVISGQPSDGPLKKPFLLRLVGCEDVTISGVRLQNSAAWTLNFFRCRQCAVSDVTIRSHGLPNNDGLDLDSCQNMRVSRCNIDSDDDALCFKTTSAEPCSQITVYECTLKSKCGAVKFGTESLGDFQGIRVTDCKIIGGGLGGIKLLSVDGAHLEDVVLSNITMTDVSVPIFVRLGGRLKTFQSGQTARPVGTIRNIIIRNIQAQGTGIGILISGIPGHCVENLTLDHVALTLPGGGSGEALRRDIVENEAAYPEITMFGNDWPAYGIYARHVKGLTLHRATVTLAAPDTRPLMRTEDASGIKSEPGAGAAP